MTTDEPLSDGASVPWLIQVLDADIRAICQDEAIRWIFEQHDLDYGRGGTEPERMWADIRMVKNMQMSHLSDANCLTFFDAVRQFGGSHWRYPAPEETPGVQAP